MTITTTTTETENGHTLDVQRMMERILEKNWCFWNIMIKFELSWTWCRGT